MAQLNFDGNPDDCRTERILAALADYGPVRSEDLDDFTNHCDRLGIFLGLSADTLLRQAKKRIVKQAFRAKRDGLTRVIYTGEMHVLRHLSTAGQWETHFHYLESRHIRDLRMLRREKEYGEDRFHISIHSPLLDLDFGDDPDTDDEEEPDDE